MNKLLVEKYGTRLHVHTLLLQSGGGGGRDAKATKLTLRIVVFWVERISCLSPVCRMRICARLDPATAAALAMIIRGVVRILPGGHTCFKLS